MKMETNPAHPSPRNKERMLHEPQIEKLIKRRLKAKAGIFF
jgi:hypothetical protein